ncbi:ATP-binding protein [Haloimpatiens sp. FM7330]|uniref:ATP-binding protein n=1 Tax=Haloimpatiens sp. FM7330 TaxID=3298610 RepID=UPI0036393DA1
MWFTKVKIKDKNKLKKMLIIITIVVLASQIYLDLYISNFRVAVAICLFAVFMFLFEEMNSIKIGLITAVLVYGLRVLVHGIRTGNFNSGVYFYFPEMFFYISYAVFLYFVLKKVQKKELNKLFICLIACDYFANFIEILIREKQIIFMPHNYKITAALLLVAFVRSSIVWIILNFVRYYKMLLLKEEHEDRYRKLLIMTSSLKSETYWMKKTMDNLEKTMASAYELFENITTEKDKELWADKAVNIAKDVHEIKKEYGLVVRGVEEITKNKLKDEGMYFKDLTNILENSIKTEIKYLGRNIHIEFYMSRNFYTNKHYYLMSIFRNIIMNSIDAIDESKDGEIIFEHKETKKEHIFYIKDNGCGIKKEDFKYVFSPGYSTKINYGTGEINRGLGLSIVKDIVENVLKGKINLKSTQKTGTCFEICISKSMLEEDKNEDIYSRG